MMQIPKPSEGGSFETTPSGTHVATCYRFIDKGTQVNEFNGERKTRHEIMLSWEIADEFMEDGRPFTAHKTYTWSMHEKATLRKDLEAWRGKSFDDDDFPGGAHPFETKNLLGKACMLNIVHEAKGDKIYAKISSIGKLVKGISPPPVANESAYLALTKDGWNQEVFDALSEKMRTTISASPEYKDLMQKLKTPGPSALAEIIDDDEDRITF